MRSSRVRTSPASRISGKRLAIDTLGNSADFAIYQPVSRNGLDPNKDVTLLWKRASGLPAIVALFGGSVGDQCRVMKKLLKLERPLGEPFYALTRAV